MRLLRVFILPLLTMVSLHSFAQENIIRNDSAQKSNTLLTIREIHLSGNKRTKDFIILRELPFKKGDELTQSSLDRLLVLARQQVMNTLLFVDVNVYMASTKANETEINVDLKERWYFFPMPYFRLIDRNFNQWWVEQNRSLDRVNYGLKFTQHNTTGRNDELNIWLISGYTQQATIRYDLPFFEKTLRHGFNIGLIYATQKEVNYATGDNKQLFFKQETITKKATRFDLTYSYRPDVKNRHYFRVSYNDESVADTVLKINPLFYPDHKSRIQFIDFGYQFKHYNVDYISYPTRGFLFEGNLYKRGISSQYSLWQASARAVYVIPLQPSKSFVHLEALAMTKLPSNDYFYNQRMFGYGYFQLRGLEYNVVDGLSGAALKATLHKQVFSFILKNPFKSKTHDRIPIRFFLKAYGDLGYGHARTPKVSNTLNNTLLRTWGLGMDIVSIYDFVFKIEYSFNQLGRDGLYLQTRNDF